MILLKLEINEKELPRILFAFYCVVVYFSTGLALIGQILRKECSHIWVVFYSLLFGHFCDKVITLDFWCCLLIICVGDV